MKYTDSHQWIKAYKLNEYIISTPFHTTPGGGGSTSNNINNSNPSSDDSNDLQEFIFWNNSLFERKKWLTAKLRNLQMIS